MSSRILPVALACPWGALVAIALLLSGPAVSAAETTPFSALVVSQVGGKPVAGATVSIAGLPGTARTDDQGRFTWAPAPAVPFHVIVVLATGQVTRPVLVEALGEGPMRIEVNALADESVTVLGVAPSIDSAPAAGTTMLSSSQIAQRSPENLMQALETVPGVSQVSEGHAAVPAVRGMARGRTLLLIDGARVTSERRVGPSASFLDPSSVEGIDVARGPGSVAYGSDALGGVISIRTRRAEPGSPLKGRFTGTFGAGIPEARGTMELSKGLAQGGVLVQAHVRNAEDYDSPNGEVFNSGWADQGFLVNVTHAVGRGFLAASWQSDFGRDFERPRNNSRTVRFFYPYENSHRFTASYEVPDVAGFKKLVLNGFMGSYEQRTDQDRFATATTGRSLERADVSANDFHVKAHAERIVKDARLDVGIDVNGRYGLEALDIIQAWDLFGTQTRDTVNVSVDNARRVDSGVYAQIEAGVGRLARVSGGLRADYVSSVNEGGYFGDRSAKHSAVSGFTAVTVGPFEGLSFTAQLARGFRDPVLSDRFYRGPSGRGFITGNPDLDPETSLQLDLATRYAFGTTQVAVYFYQYRITDLIERYQTQTDFFFFRNRGRARLRGVEFETSSLIGRGFTVELSAQLSRGVALDDNANLDDVSPKTLSLLGRKAFGERGYAQARLAFHAKDDRPGPSEIAAPGATLLDVGGGWRLARQLELRAQVRNLLDDEYYASPDARWVYAPGRSATLTAVVQF